MNEMLDWLRSIGWAEEQIAYVAANFDNLQEYLLYLRAVYDDRREYVD